MQAKSLTPMVVLFLLLPFLGRTGLCGIASQDSSKSLQQYSLPEADLCGRSYDLFYFVQQWQISSCNVRPCLKPARPIFSIYGFWPSRFSGTPICKMGTSFDPAKISDLKDDLDREWPSLQQEENEEAWKQEWESHGSCSEAVLPQHAFFQTTLKLKQNFDLFNILANKAVLPLGEVYGLDNISDVIKRATGHRAQVECRLYKRIPLLSNIFLCFDYTATNLIDCPNIRRCRHEAILFPFDSFGL